MSYVPEPPPRKRSAMWPWIAGGCLAAVVLLVGVVAALMSALIGSMKASDPFKSTLAKARADVRVQQALGTPIDARWWISGNINLEGNDGTANLTIPLVGSRAKGHAHVAGTKKDGAWSYHVMTVTPEKGTEIDLLDVPE